MVPSFRAYKRTEHYQAHKKICKKPIVNLIKLFEFLFLENGWSKNFIYNGRALKNSSTLLLLEKQ